MEQFHQENVPFNQLLNEATLFLSWRQRSTVDLYHQRSKIDYTAKISVQTSPKFHYSWKILVHCALRLLLFVFNNHCSSSQVQVTQRLRNLQIQCSAVLSWFSSAWWPVKSWTLAHSKSFFSKVQDSSDNIW